jgi:hypothetical protein
MDMARTLLNAAIRDEQAVYQLSPADDVSALRAEIRRLARAEGIRIRTGLLDGDVLAVIMADAALWGEDAATMRGKLRPGRESP